jgi:uncharacterized integral membrane protein
MDRILLKAKRFLAALAVLLVLIFLFQNLEAVEFNFLGWSISMSRALLAALIFAIGVGVGLAIDPFRRRGPPHPP